jgi:hypothetical protein
MSTENIPLLDDSEFTLIEETYIEDEIIKELVSLAGTVINEVADKIQQIDCEAVCKTIGSQIPDILFAIFTH